MFFFKKKVSLIDIIPENFVDIHSHLLPGIDDGAKDLQDSISLIKKLRAYGIKNFITTPHILGNLYPNTPEIIREKLNIVKEELIKQELSDVNIKAAAEYMIDEKFISLLENDKEILTLKDNLVLVEMSYLSPPINLYDILFQLQLKGYKPVLAHPERYVLYQNNFNEYYKLKKAGCLFQLNILSLTKHYGSGIQKISKRLLKDKLYDFVGSDTHHSNHLALLQEVDVSKDVENIKTLLYKNTTYN